MTFDELRRKNPTLGFAAYALEPDGPVTIEVHTFGLVATFEAPTFARCVEKAFPPALKPKNELTPLPPAPPAMRTEEVDLDVAMPDFLRRPTEKNIARSVTEAPATSAETGSTPAGEPHNSVFD